MNFNAGAAMFINRKVLKSIKKTKKSILLIGPRQTGKSTLIKTLNPDLSVNLSNEGIYLNFASNARELEQLIRAQKPKTVFIDEIQRLPSLLNTIQSILDDWSDPPQFYITGSSARKLRRGQANLLPGRIFSYNLGPLSASELEYSLRQDVITHGSLPGIYTERELEVREKLLKSYAGIYLKEEIQAEALTKNLEGFARFIFVAAAEATKYLDLAKLAMQAKIERHSAVRWFELLEDTLMVTRASPFTKSNRKRLVQHPRFFFFDNGILNALLKNFVDSADRSGFLFENLFFSQLQTSAFAADKEIDVSSFRTDHGAELDFIVEVSGTVWAIECKASTDIAAVNTKPFKSFEAVYRKPHQRVIAYRGAEEKEIMGIKIIPWQKLLKHMGL